MYHSVQLEPHPATVHPDDDRYREPATRSPGYSRAEHLRVLGAVSRAGNDWHQAFHALRTRGDRENNISWSTFVEYAGTFTDTYEVREDDAATDDVADVVLAALEPAGDRDPVSDVRVARVQEAVWRLPKRQREAVVAWSLGHTLSETQKRTYRRAIESLREELSDLATGTHVLRAPKPPAPDPHRLPNHWESSRQGEPRAPHVGPRPVDTHAPKRMVDGIEFHKIVRPFWTREWVASVPPVPRNWHTLPPGTPWRYEGESDRDYAARVKNVRARHTS